MVQHVSAPAPSPLKLAVVGAGVMGRHHLIAAKNCSDVTLMAVVDAVHAHARTAAAEFGGAAAAGVGALIGSVDAAVIAAPTATHGLLAIPLLNAGIHCLVEKPLAGSEDECRALIAAAKDRAILQVGHIERFNPAVETLFASGLTPKSVRKVTARRMNPGSARVKDIDVVLDLMVHDLDIIIALKHGIPVTNVTARGDGNEAVATLIFADGSAATVTASRITATRVRDLEVTLDDGFVRLDYLTRDVRTHRQGPGESDGPMKERTAVSDGDAIKRQLTAFVACARTRQRPRVSGEDALAVMILAWRIQAALAGRPDDPGR